MELGECLVKLDVFVTPLRNCVRDQIAYAEGASKRRHLRRWSDVMAPNRFDYPIGDAALQQCLSGKGRVIYSEAIDFESYAVLRALMLGLFHLGKEFRIAIE
jgi:hypothetical protein